jgi:hypothetical protein
MSEEVKKEQPTEEKKEVIDYADPEEEKKGNFEQKVDLPDQVKKVTGEEAEECIYKQRAKLYRLRDEQWKERGVGNAKLMRHKETKKIRMIMRQEKTLKPIANFNVAEDPLCVLLPMNNNDKAYCWSCYDCSDEESAVEKLALRLKDADLSQKFKDAIDAAQVYNKLVGEEKTEGLVEAPIVEDIEEVAEVDIDNVHAGDEAKEGE